MKVKTFFSFFLWRPSDLKILVNVKEIMCLCPDQTPVFVSQSFQSEGRYSEDRLKRAEFPKVWT